MAKKQGARVILEMTFEDGEVLRWTSETNQDWVTAEKLGEMMEDLMLAAGYHPENVKEVFCTDCVSNTPEDAAECCPDCGPECCPVDEPQEYINGSNVSISGTPDWDLGFTSTDNPCEDCEEACEDTACLLREECCG